MDIDADDFDSVQTACQCIRRARAAPGNPKLRLRGPRRDFGVGLRIDIGIDADRHRRAFVARERDFVQHLQLRLTLDVELMDAGVDAELHLRPRLADAGKHDARRRNAYGQGLLEFTARHDISTGTQARKSLQHREIAVRLYRESNQRIFWQRIGDGAILPLQHRGRIAIEWRADAIGEGRQIDIRGKELVMEIPKAAHSPMGIGGRDGSFWPRAFFEPSGSSRAFFTPQPASEKISTKARMRRPIISTAPARRRSVRARARAPCRRYSRAN